MIKLQSLSTDEIKDLKKKWLTIDEIRSIIISIDQINNWQIHTHEEVFWRLYAKIWEKIGNNFNIKVHA